MKTLKVFYNENQTAEKNTSFSPSAFKPAQVLQSWRDLGLPIRVTNFRPLTPRQIATAHDLFYVQGVLGCNIPNGFGNQLREIAKTLPYTTGSFVAAAMFAATHKRPAASLTSGFHHAGFDNGGGFCTFNGLVIAAMLLKKWGLAKKVGILDLDMHYGNGTDNIIKKLNLDFISHYTFGGTMVSKESAEIFLKQLPDIVCNLKDCDVILFQAGADPHVDDPLGGVLTSEQMQRRDRIVFENAKKIGVPVAWNLAGGYQSPLRKVLDIHDATAIECLKAYKED